MRKAILSAAMGAVLLFWCAPGAHADDWAPPAPFEIVSSDGTMVFRFSPDDPFGGAAGVAGVYTVGEPEELVYAVQGLRSWAFPENFFFSEDFRSFVFVPSPTEDIALEFYTDGVVVKTYRVKDLVKDRSKLTHSTSSVWWMSAAPAVAGEDVLSVTTVDARTYSFDITTGSILEKTHESSAGYWPWIIVGVLGVAVLIFAVRRFLPSIERPGSAQSRDS